MRISVATNLTPEYATEISRLVREGILSSDTECFGACPSYHNALDRFFDKTVTRERFCEHIRDITESGLSFDYLLNSLSLDRQTLPATLDMLRSLSIRTVTVSRDDAIGFLARYAPDMDIVVSIIRGTCEVSQVIAWSRFPRVKRIVFDQSVNHDFPRLLQLVKTAQSHHIETELLANELCFSKCPHRYQHYLSDSDPDGSEGRHGDTCGIFRHRGIIAHSPWIRPEDLLLYERIGIDYVKLSGRNASTSLIIRCLEAYARRRYDGDFFDLMDLDGKRDTAEGRHESRSLPN